MKHLANCTPTEFMPQAVKLKGPLTALLDALPVNEIRNEMREYAEKNEDKSNIANVAFLGEIINRAFETAPELTREALAVAAFTDPDDFDAHSMPEYLDAAFEIYASASIRRFFTFSVAPGLMKS